MFLDQKPLVIKAITFVMAFLLHIEFTPAVYASEQQAVTIQPSLLVYFSLADENGFPKKEPNLEFDCTDKIFTVLELTNYPVNRYELSILWIDPTGTSREHTKYPFNVRDRKNTTRLWAWLSLSRATGAGLLQWLDPSAGLEEFIGPWSVEVRINNKKVETKRLDVSF
jgi:hypothetical protein